MGVPASSVNCLDGCGFLVFASNALGMGAMRVPRPAAGIITITFMAGCKYTRAHAGVQIWHEADVACLAIHQHAVSTYNGEILSIREMLPCASPHKPFTGS